MSFATLTADADFIREGNNDILSDYDDTALQELMIVGAKRELKNDLIRAWNLDETDTDDMSYLDNIIDSNEELLKVVLAYKQLYKYYFFNNQGEESQSYKRMIEYKKLYESEAMNFYSLRSDDLTTTRVTRFKR